MSRTASAAALVCHRYALGKPPCCAAFTMLLLWLAPSAPAAAAAAFAARKIPAAPAAVATAATLHLGSLPRCRTCSSSTKGTADRSCAGSCGSRAILVHTCEIGSSAAGLAACPVPQQGSSMCHSMLHQHQAQGTTPGKTGSKQPIPTTTGNWIAVAHLRNRGKHGGWPSTPQPNQTQAQCSNQVYVNAAHLHKLWEHDGRAAQRRVCDDGLQLPRQLQADSNKTH